METTLETGGVDAKLHSKRVEKICTRVISVTIEIKYTHAQIYPEDYTRFECSFISSLLVSGVVLDLLHSFRV
jgi:hypothetical protein